MSEISPVKTTDLHADRNAESKTVSNKQSDTQLDGVRSDACEDSSIIKTDSANIVKESVRSSLDDDLSLSDDSSSEVDESNPTSPPSQGLASLKENIENSVHTAVTSYETTLIPKLESASTLLQCKKQYRNLLDRLLSNFDDKSKKVNKQLECKRTKVSLLKSYINCVQKRFPKTFFLYLLIFQFHKVQYITR